MISTVSDSSTFLEISEDQEGYISGQIMTLQAYTGSVFDTLTRKTSQLNLDYTGAKREFFRRLTIAFKDDRGCFTDQSESDSSNPKRKVIDEKRNHIEGLVVGFAEIDPEVEQSIADYQGKDIKQTSYITKKSLLGITKDMGNKYNQAFGTLCEVSHNTTQQTDSDLFQLPKYLWGAIILITNAAAKNENNLVSIECLKTLTDSGSRKLVETGHEVRQWSPLLAWLGIRLRVNEENRRLLDEEFSRFCEGKKHNPYIALTDPVFMGANFIEFWDRLKNNRWIDDEIIKVVSGWLPQVKAWEDRIKNILQFPNSKRMKIDRVSDGGYFVQSDDYQTTPHDDMVSAIEEFSSEKGKGESEEVFLEIVFSDETNSISVSELHDKLRSNSKFINRIWVRHQLGFVWALPTKSRFCPMQKEHPQRYQVVDPERLLVGDNDQEDQKWHEIVQQKARGKKFQFMIQIPSWEISISEDQIMEDTVNAAVMIFHMEDFPDLGLNLEGGVSYQIFMEKLSEHYIESNADAYPLIQWQHPKPSPSNNFSAIAPEAIGEK